MWLYRQATVDLAEVNDARVFAEKQWRIAENEVEEAIALIAKMELEETGGNTDTHDQNQQAPTKDDPIGDDPNDPSRFLLSLLGTVLEGHEDPNELICTTWDAILQVLHAEEVDRDLKRRAINHIFDTVFDLQLMAKLVAARKHWSKFTLAQRQVFTDCFAKDFKDSFRKVIMLHADRTMTVMSGVHKKGQVAYIPMELTCDNRAVSMLYKLRKGGDHWKVYDVQVEGISIVLTYRAQFNDILRRTTTEDFITRYRERMKTNPGDSKHVE
jgi:phospholipid transport system substrate-binding protein